MGLPLITGKPNFDGLELNCKSTVFGFVVAPMLLQELLLSCPTLTLSKLNLTQPIFRLTHKSHSHSPEYHFQHHLPQVVRKFPR